MQQELANLCKFLYHVTPVVIFQMQSCLGSIFFWFYELEVRYTVLQHMIDTDTVIQVKKLPKL